jgi:type II secretory pathway component PulF
VLGALTIGIFMTLVLNSIDVLSQGQSIHQSLMRADPSHLLFGHETLQLIKVGEESGELSSYSNIWQLFMKINWPVN